MKPSWDDPKCPAWANWLAMDADRSWYWFSDKPKFNRNIENGNYWSTDRLSWRASASQPCSDSLEARPTVTNEKE